MRKNSSVWDAVHCSHTHVIRTGPGRFSRKLQNFWERSPLQNSLHCLIGNPHNSKKRMKKTHLNYADTTVTCNLQLVFQGWEGLRQSQIIAIQSTNEKDKQCTDKDTNLHTAVGKPKRLQEATVSLKAWKELLQNAFCEFLRKTKRWFGFKRKLLRGHCVWSEWVFAFDGSRNDQKAQLVLEDH